MNVPLARTTVPHKRNALITKDHLNVMIPMNCFSPVKTPTSKSVLKDTLSTRNVKFAMVFFILHHINKKFKFNSH